ncbi:MAG TPA: sigma-70 family RNA polymerase sigma factor [Terracidiphilus sp.]|nr:sigma-70 family RNA polymerase sigma factor [Terracidiphilus sp.]
MHENPSNPIAAGLRSNQGASETSGAAGGTLVADESLLNRVCAKDRGAMAELFERYSGMVYSVAFRILRDPGNAEDVMQDVFFKVWRQPGSFLIGRGSLGAWLAVVARNRAIDLVRNRKPSDAIDEVVLPAKTDLSAEIERNAIIEKVRGFLAGLPPEQRISLEMAFFEGLSHAEISARTGDPLGTVKSRIRSALILLRKAIQP